MDSTTRPSNPNPWWRARWRPLTTLAGLAAGSVVGCASPSGRLAGEDGIGDGDGDASDDGTEDGGSGGTDDDGGDGTEDDDGDVKLDVGDDDGTPTEGCSKVDFLFVIDNSVSMNQEQTALTTAFPAFIATIEDTLTAGDFHIMVVDTDAETRCTPETCAGPLSSLHATCKGDDGQPNYACTGTFEACDSVRGAGVVHPAGDLASNMPCAPFGGHRYIVADEPALAETFQCMATVGTAGFGEERPMDAMVAAVSSALQGPGGCNEGFLRDDAILVVTFITDDKNMVDVATAQQTYGALVASKGGDVDRIVMLGLIPQPDAGDCATGGAHWRELVGLFGERGLQGPVCASEYGSFFAGAVATIDTTCQINPG
jgi:hypothetical protein